MKTFTRISLNLQLRWVHFFIALMFFATSGNGQNVSINTTLAPANAAAGLDVDFPSQGLLIPRVTLTGLNSVTPLSAHVAGMMLYNTATTGDVTPGLYANDGVQWAQTAPDGSAPGEMKYWNGTSWATIAPGIAGQYLTAGSGGVPQWTGNSSGYVTLSTSQVSSVATNTATCGGTISHNGGTAVTARGVCWSTSADPTIALPTKTSDGTGNGTFTSSLTGLSSSTTYYVRAWATNSLGTVYGNEVVFTTN
jgi:hypothetical protein